MQLISQENPVMEISRFEGNGPEWLVPGRTPFAFGKGQDFEITYWCMPAELSLYFFIFFLCFHCFLLSFLSFLFPCFLFCDPSQMVVIVILASFSVVIPPPFAHSKGLIL